MSQSWLTFFYARRRFFPPQLKSSNHKMRRQTPFGKTMRTLLWHIQGNYGQENSKFNVKFLNGVLRTSFGHISVVFRSYFGRISVVFRSHFGRILVVFRSCYGCILVAFWSQFGRILVVFWTYLVWNLDAYLSISGSFSNEIDYNMDNECIECQKMFTKMHIMPFVFRLHNWIFHAQQVEIMD